MTAEGVSRETENGGPDRGPADPRPSWAAWVVLLPVRVYRQVISPLLPPTCRFYPSCSAYAVEALTIHGALRGSWLALRRLLRCGPWHPGGVDLVPPRCEQVGDSPPEEAGESASREEDVRESAGPHRTRACHNTSAEE